MIARCSQHPLGNDHAFIGHARVAAQSALGGQKGKGELAGEKRMIDALENFLRQQHSLEISPPNNAKDGGRSSPSIPASIVNSRSKVIPATACFARLATATVDGGLHTRARRLRCNKFPPTG
jgi:hypothetical protein